MTAELTYQKLLLKINENNSGGNIACEKSVAVLLINECKNRWVEELLKQKDSILIDSLQETVVTREYLVGIDKGNYIEYPLNEDFYEDILTKCEAEKDSCKGVIYSREAKNQNKNIWEFDENLKPDFDYEWTFHTIQGNMLRVYKNDFQILKTTFEYYKKIEDFDIEGYINLEGQPSQNKPLTLSDQYIDQILNRAAEEFMRNYLNQAGLAIAKDRTNSEE